MKQLDEMITSDRILNEKNICSKESMLVKKQLEESIMIAF